MGRDEERTLSQLKTFRKTLVDPAIVTHRGRIVKTTGDGMLVEFASAVDAVRCAVEVQREMAKQNSSVPQELRIEFRIGIHVGDIIIDDNDIFGDGVNIAARLEGIAEPGGICVSDDAYRQIRGKVEIAFDDIGEQDLKNIAEPMRAWRVRITDEDDSGVNSIVPDPTSQMLTLPDKPSIVVLPFDNMSAEAGQEYLADGIVEAITAALSWIRSFFVIARNSAFTYKGRATNVRDIGRELGVAYLLEGSVQKAGNRLRIIVQLIETEGGAHVWSSRFDGAIDEFFDLEDRITEQVAGALQPSIRVAEIERSRRKRPQDLGAMTYTMRAMPYVWALEKDGSVKALELLEKALQIDPGYPLALSLAGWCHAQRGVYNWADDIAEESGHGAIAGRTSGQPEQRRSSYSWQSSARCIPLCATTEPRACCLSGPSLLTPIAHGPGVGWDGSIIIRINPQMRSRSFERALRLSPIDPMNFNNYAGIGSAHEISQDYDKAATFYLRALEERPNARWLYRNLASTLSGAGRTEEAKEAFAKMLISYPDLTVSKFKQAMVFSNVALDRMAENLRKLGLPD